MNQAFLSLGSSLGDKKSLLESAIQELNTKGEVVATSSFLETEAWGGIAKNTFLNACLCFETTLSAEELLVFCQSIENHHGRTRTEKWEDRTLDIDILSFNNEVIDTENLQIPHPLMLERDFVMIPLKEIADVEVKDEKVFVTLQ